MIKMDCTHCTAPIREMGYQWQGYEEIYCSQTCAVNECPGAILNKVFKDTGWKKVEFK